MAGSVDVMLRANPTLVVRPARKHVSLDFDRVDVVARPLNSGYLGAFAYLAAQLGSMVEEDFVEDRPFHMKRRLVPLSS